MIREFALKVGVLRKHYVNILVVLPRQHVVKTLNFSREHRHALVLHRGTIKGADLEMEEILGLQQLRKECAAVIGRIRGVIDRRLVSTLKANKPRVLDSITLAGCKWEDDPLEIGSSGPNAIS